MFQRLGNAVVRSWPFILGGWILALVALTYIAPRWDDVIESRFTTLPPNSPSDVANELFAKAFPDERANSSVVIVLSRTDRPLDDEDEAFIVEILEPALEKIAQSATPPAGTKSDAPAAAGDGSNPERGGSLVTRIRTLDDRAARSQLMSRDKKATLVAVDLTTEFLERTAWPTIAAIEQLLDKLHRDNKVPAGLESALTGSAVVGRDVRQLELRSVAAIEIWTIALVVLLLLVIYRAPLLALVPLLTVFVAVEVSINLLAILAQAGIVTLSETLRIYITVLAYGAGVDYCLFLTARYSEELQQGAGSREAVANAIGKVGETLTASAATVIAGIAMMAFGEFGRFHQAGITIPFSLCIVLLSTLTFSSAFLCLAGRWAFWPRRVSSHSLGVGTSSSKAARHRQWTLFGLLWERIGTPLLRRPGVIFLVTVAVLLPFAGLAVVRYNQWDFGVIAGLPADAPSVIGTKRLREHFDAGVTGSITVFLRDDQANFYTAEGRQAVGKLSERLEAKKDALKIADLRSIAKPSGIGAAAEEAEAKYQKMPASARTALRERAIAHYLSSAGELEGKVTRMEVVLAIDPLSHHAIANLANLQEALRSGLPPELAAAEIHITGATATLRDVQDVTARDLRKIQVLVPLVIFVILIVVMRDIVVSLYLIATVLFSYLATLGMTIVLFQALNPEGFAGPDWKVPIMLFTILVAVGEDYNIFLMTRVYEEERVHGPVHGVVAALVKTGGIISSCGIIMAGTFASLLAGSLIEMKQLGFALAVGVLLDTLVVRGILVPAFLILWRRRKSRTRDESQHSKGPQRRAERSEPPK